VLTAIPRQGAKAHPAARQLVATCREKGQFIQGPEIAAFEETFAARLGAGHAVSAPFGRTAFYFVLKALQLPAGSDVVLPALTFWGMPDIVRAAGLAVVFADVDPNTGCMTASSLDAVLTPRTRAIVPTHLHGRPCDLDALLELAGRHHLAVIEDCAEALGATHRGRPVGTFGDGAIFSFGTFAPLDCGGGGMAVVREAAVADRVRQQAEALPWPHEKGIANRLLLGRLRAALARPAVFTVTRFPVLLAAGQLGIAPSTRTRRTRALDPLPEECRERFSNVQACLGLASLDHLDGWTAATRSHAHLLNSALSAVPGVGLPADPPDGTHVYHRYLLRVDRRFAVTRQCLRRGVELDPCLADVWRAPGPSDGRASETMAGAQRALEAVHVPVHASLTDRQSRRVARVVRTAITRRQPAAPKPRSAPAAGAGPSSS
jgi:perosamine synthetase